MQAVSSANGYKGTTFFRLLQILKLKIADNLKEIQQIPIPYILMYARSGIEGVMTGVIWERYGRDDGRDEKAKIPLYKGVLRD